MPNSKSPPDRKADLIRALSDCGDQDQARAIFLMTLQVQRADMELFDMIWKYGRTPRPAPHERVALDFSMFGKIRAACDEPERAAWADLLIGTAVRGDAEGLQLVERMVERRLSFERDPAA